MVTGRPPPSPPLSPSGPSCPFPEGTDTAINYHLMNVRNKTLRKLNCPNKYFPLVTPPPAGKTYGFQKQTFESTNSIGVYSINTLITRDWNSSCTVCAFRFWSV
jgi:hypothetical protein